VSSTQLGCKCPPTWKKVLAFLVDIFGSFLVFGAIIAYFSGDLTSSGFHLEGAPAMVAFALMITYFIAMKKLFGGTLGKKLFGISKSSRAHTDGKSE
jgi:uncharacterized RDD family membrane protein YckC